MSTKKSTNPMQYRVRSASKTINRCFRKRESAEAYYNKVVEEKADDVIIFEDIFANTIINSYYNPAKVPTATSGYTSVDEPDFGYTRDVPFTVTTNSTSDVPYVYHYKDGKLVKEELKQEVTSSREYKNGKLIRKDDGKLTFYGWLLKVFKKEK